MSKWNFKRHPVTDHKLHTDLDYYNKNNIDKLIYKPMDDLGEQETDSYSKGYEMGVSMTYIDGSYFRTNNFTAEEITQALEDGKRWIQLQNGGRINLGYVIHYEPYKFFKDSKPRNNYKKDRY